MASDQSWHPLLRAILNAVRLLLLHQQLVSWCALMASPFAHAIRILPSEARVRQSQRVLLERLSPPLHSNCTDTSTSFSLSSSYNCRRRGRHEERKVNVVLPDSPDDHLVDSLPLLKKGTFLTEHWAGHLPASASGEKYFFYWLFAPDEIDEADAPLIIWLNGGPACSSMDGLFIENGPFRLTVNDATGLYEVTTSPYSWHKAPAYTLYIDQPIGTGLSFTTTKNGYPTNDLEVNTDLYYFLQQFFALHRDKFIIKNRLERPFYFSGESYAGHYIPSIINFILKQNDKIAAHTGTNERALVLPVSGGAIGNGWVDPYYQYSGADFAFGHALIGLSEVAAFQVKETQCQEKLNQGIYNDAVCFDLIDDIINESHGSNAATKASSYDVRRSELRGAPRTFPPGHRVVETYLGGADLSDADAQAGLLDPAIYTKVLSAIHATAATQAGQRYQECTDPPYNALSQNDGKGVVDDVVEILKHPDGVQLLFFNGIHDMVCNHVSNEKFLEMLPWEHTADWMKAERYAWVAESATTPGQISGYMREYENLKFLKVLDAGHMVPMDVPNVALDMMKLFTSGGDFHTYQQKLSRKAEPDGTCPLCPACAARDSASSETSMNDSKASGRLGSFVISYAWVVAAIGLLVSCLVLSAFRRRGNVHALAVPQYELELRDSSSYSDAVDGGGEPHNGTYNTVT
jgi:carboxypeptidase D